VPGFIFVNLYTTPLHLDMINVLFCGLLLLIMHDMIGRIVAKIRHYDIGMTNAFKNSVMFNNSGNIGVSLITLIFSSGPFVVNGTTPYIQTAITAQIIILVLQNISGNTLGFYNAGRSRLSSRDSLLQVMKMPSIYVILLAFILKNMSFDLTQTAVWPALEYIKNGLVPVALLTLGVQLSKTTFDFSNVEAYLSVMVKLIVSPLLALICIYLLGFNGVVAQTIFIAHSVPTAVNTALIAVEQDSYPDFASQAVMMSTVLSALTLTLAIFAARILFPV
ncbi:MAG TPA: AEC family transporter, partial [Patescibacteria group bacterium]|nr:AEC family transporter [Patescibacteria group bacterium]